MKLVDVFRTDRRADTYLYVEKGADFDSLPESLREIFGEPALVLSLKLTEERKLARCQGKEILDAIEAQGFFLQMPPPAQGSEPC